MNGLPNEIFRRWGHSFEEDTGDITVYRPTEYAFPRARGRAGIEFRPTGEFIEWAIGPADAPRGIKGNWQIESPGQVLISFEDTMHAPRLLKIIHCDNEILKVRQQPGSA